MYLVSSGAIPAPSKNVFTRFEVSRNHDGVLPQGGGALYVLPYWPPCAALGERALLQVSLFELLPLAFPLLVHRLDHREVGRVFQYVPGEAILSDGTPSTSRHLAQPVSVTSTMSSARSPDHILHAANLPLGGDHVGEVVEPGVSSERGGSPPSTPEWFVLTTLGACRPIVLAPGTPVGIATEDSTTTWSLIFVFQNTGIITIPPKKRVQHEFL